MIKYEHLEASIKTPTLYRKYRDFKMKRVALRLLPTIESLTKLYKTKIGKQASIPKIVGISKEEEN